MSVRPPCPEATNVTTTFYAEESANRRNSILLAFVVIAFLAVFGFVIGFSIGTAVATRWRSGSERW